MPKEPRIIFKGFCTLEAHETPGQNFETMVLRTSDSVAGLLFDNTNDRVLLVKQRRQAMVRSDNPDGSITELVAGRFDVNLGPRALLVKEAKEEAGVTLLPSDIELLNGGRPLALSAGIITERCYLAFAEVDCAQIDENDEGYGVAEEGESISRVWIPAEQFIDYAHRGHHECLRTYTLALHLENRRLKGSPK